VVQGWQKGVKKGLVVGHNGRVRNKGCNWQWLGGRHLDDATDVLEWQPIFDGLLVTLSPLLYCLRLFDRPAPDTTMVSEIIEDV